MKSLTVTRRVRVSAAVLAIAAGLCGGTALAADGERDPTFDGDGREVSDPTGYDESVTDLAIDAEGRLVVVSTGSDPAKIVQDRAIVTRYNPDGSLDKSFGGGGNVFVEWGASAETLNGVAIDGAGRIVVAGATVNGPSGFDFAVARFLSDGKHDPSFGENGLTMFQIPEGGTDLGQAVAVDSQNRVLVGGYAVSVLPSATRFALARFDANGDPDKSFSGDGSVITEFPGMFSAEAYAVGIDSSGRPILAGTASSLDSNSVFAVSRYDDAGGLDSSFDDDGRATLDFGSRPYEAAFDLDIDADGRLVLTGEAGIALDKVIHLGRLLPNGTPDAGFAAGGKVTIDEADPVYARGSSLDKAGRLVVGGTNGTGEGREALVTRFESGGAVDPAFGAGGFLYEDFLAVNATGSDLEVDAAGRYVLAGTAFAANGARSVGLARYLTGYPGPPAGPAVGPRCKGKPSTVAGTPKRDRLKGTKKRDVIAALGGNDVVQGLAGNDLICGGAGKDLVKAGGGLDQVYGEGGNDRLFGQGGKDKLFGQKGKDLLVGGSARDVLRGGAGRDTQRP